MDDYKELIGNLRFWADACDRTNNGCQARFCLSEAADAIEQLGKDNAVLTKERDAAIADLKDHGRNCKTCLHGGRGKNDCLDREEVPCKWEWRGVKEESDEKERNV